MMRDFKKLELKPLSTERDPTFPEIIAARVLSGNNQDCRILFNGFPGCGKSLATLSLAHDLSRIFAKRLGGKPDGSGGVFSTESTAYFSLDNVAIMTVDEVIRVMRNIRPFQIIVLDDAGAEAAGQRNFMSKQNKAVIKLIQTVRTQNNIILISSPSQDLIDKTVRGLINYRVFLTQQFFRYGFTLGKLSTIKRISTKDGSNNLYPFLRSKGKIYNFIRFNLPPNDLRRAYEAKRKALERTMNLRTITELEGELAEDDKTVKAIDPKIELEQFKRKTNAQLYKTFIQNGMKAQDALEKASETTGITLGLRAVQKDCKVFFGSD
jgi:DNA polymerase III delta prime subunit